MSAFSRPRLERLERVLAGHVERGDMPGIVALVSCRGEAHVETLGTLALGEAAPMRRDTIFRIASLSKPIAAVAAMILVEECRLRLDDSIEPWIPELANRRVLKSLASPLEDTVPARRAVTVRDLLTYRMGFGSVMARPDTYPIQERIRELRIGGDGPPIPARFPSTARWLESLASLPWLAQPGERWLYHVSGDVLGVLVSRVSGQSLGAFLRERLFEPLGMKDTDFHVAPEKVARLTTSYVFDAAAKKLAVFDPAATSAWGAPPPMESAGGGLVSTLDDCHAFARMMLERGRGPSGRILSPAAVALMTSDQLRPADREGAGIFFGDHRSWGFGMAVETRRDEIWRVPGRFGWDGGLGTSMYVDPANEVIGILLTQRMMDSPKPPRVFGDFWTLAYGAIE